MLAALFCAKPSQPLFGGAQCGIGNAPFGLDPGLVCGCLGESQFGTAQRPIGITQRGREQRAALLIGQQSRFAAGQILFQSGKRRGSVLRQPVGIAAVFLKPLVLAIKILEALLGSFELAGQLRHAVAVRGAIIAPVGQLVARFGKHVGQPVLGFLRYLHLRLRSTDPRFGALCFAARSLGGGRGVAPAGEDQPCFGHADPVAQPLVAFGGAGLTAQGSDLLVKLAHQVFQPRQVGLGRAQFLLGILAPRMKPGDASGLFQHHPPFRRFGGDHCGNLALTDQRGGVRPGGGIGENQRDVLGPDIAAVDTVGAARAALNPPNNFHVAVIIAGIDMQHDLGKIARRALRGTGEDHVFHAAAAQRFGAAFAHHPANGFEQVRFAAAVGADNPGQPGFDAQFSRLDKALETSELEPLDAHLICPGPPPAGLASAGQAQRL